MNNARTNWVSLIAVLATCACFELEVVEGRPHASAPLGPLLIDDFEDGDRMPTSSLFSAWGCSESRPGDSLNCETAEGFNSDWSHALRYQIADLPDARIDDPVVAVRSAARIKLDISGYEKLVFSARLVTESSTPPRRTLLAAALACSDDPFDDGYWVESSIEPSSEWQTFALPLVDFVIPFWEKGSIDVVYCTMLLDYLYFFVRPDLNDGASVTGQLWLDNVYLQ